MELRKSGSRTELKLIVLQGWILLTVTVVLVIPALGPFNVSLLPSHSFRQLVQHKARGPEESDLQAVQ